MHFDILISGAGPVGLALARTLAGSGLTIGLIEQHSEAALAEAAFDGREIALTQDSAAHLRELGLWTRIEAMVPGAFSPLRDAQVQNGPSPFAMVIPHDLAGRSELGWLVSNHLIRRAAFQALQAAQAEHGDITLLTGCAVADVQVDAERARVTLADGSEHSARLLVAADSRFSTTRRAVGIGASQHDFGRTMLVCQMTHERAHDHVAWEWFGYGQTLALLPMNDCPETGMPRSSVVLTLPHQRIMPLARMAAAAFGADMAQRFDHRLGAMTLASTRHTYPLVGVYPSRMVAPRFACVGDAAVGMHPVTAHGFNFGLLSVRTLAPLLRAAAAQGQDVAAEALLARYERTHRRATRPLYEITRAIATLYTAESAPARLARDAALRVGEALTPFKRLVAASLAGHAPSP
ncbi:MAG: 5-demethoxyubiquinol-8 5-hydroxylase UbiM [Proteobacteria bacterium]|nr:5-demethoxyubiquinol-8 5-hydroxylase UbiM [Pseudomonadota bacterium]